MRVNEAPSRRSYETKVFLFGQLPPSRLCQCSGATEKSPRLVKILTMSFYCVTLLIFNEIVFLLSLLALFVTISSLHSILILCLSKIVSLKTCVLKQRANSAVPIRKIEIRNTILRGALIKITICFNDTGNFPSQNLTSAIRRGRSFYLIIRTSQFIWNFLHWKFTILIEQVIIWAL